MTTVWLYVLSPSSSILNHIDALHYKIHMFIVFDTTPLTAPGAVRRVNFISTRTYIAGTIISAISYFCFIIFGLGEFSSA